MNCNQYSLGGYGQQLTVRRNRVLRNEAESSESEVSGRGFQLKKRRSHLFSPCVTLCCGVFLAASVFTIYSLVWMYLQLKEDIRELQVKLARVHIVQTGVSDQLPDMSSARDSISHQFKQLKDGLIELHKNVSVLISQATAVDNFLRFHHLGNISTDAGKRGYSSTLQISSYLNMSKKLSRMEKNFKLLNVSFHQKFEQFQTEKALLKAINTATHKLSARLKLVEASIHQIVAHRFSSNNSTGAKTNLFMGHQN